MGGAQRLASNWPGNSLVVVVDRMAAPSTRSGLQLARHNAATECFRRSMTRGQTFEGRSEALTQANKFSRSYAMLLETLKRYHQACSVRGRLFAAAWLALVIEAGAV